MKKTVLYLVTLSAVWFSCNSEQKKLEREYGALLEKEYAEVGNSERYKKYVERYALLTELSKEVYNSDEIEIASPEKVDTLCFIPPKEHDLNLDKEIDEKMAGKKDARAFSSYINLSKEVSATIIAESFFTKETGAAAFETERDYHRLATIADKNEYFADRLSDTAYLYESFCDDRILMDRVNNSRYILIQKDLVNVDSKLEGGNKDEFTSGVYVGVVYVYDINAKKFINSITIGGTNSEVVEGAKKSMEFSINSDLYDNISKALEEELSSNFGLRGGVPRFFKP